MSERAGVRGFSPASAVLAFRSFTSGWPLTITSPMYASSFVARSRRAVKLEQLRRLVDEPRRHVARQELGCVDQVEQERDVRLHAADAELLQAALHPAGGVDEAQPAGGHLHQQRIVERRDDRAGERRAGVEADAQAAGER